MQHDQSLERLVLELVSRNDYKPLKPKRLAEQLKLDQDQLKPLKRALKHLVKAGHIAWGPQHLVLKSVPTKKSNEIIGRFRRAAGGYGFVTQSPSESDPTPADLFVPENKTLDAVDGDLVRAKISRNSNRRDLRISGRIVEVIERRNFKFVGTYFERNGSGFVRVDGQKFQTDVLVGDASSKNGKAGDKVVIEMVKFPTSYAQGEAVIVEILGDRGAPGVDTRMVIREFNLPGEFPEAVLDDARQQAQQFDGTIPENRTDLTRETIITIDPISARDFDDAISLEQLENGHWKLGVHIADVSHFVKSNSELDDEAFRRATSVYLPDQVIPMLPEIISNNLASLQPGRVRFSMTAFIEFSEDGIPIQTELLRSAIKSTRRFTYEEVDDYLQDDAPWREKLSSEVFQLLRDMHTLAMRLRARRMARGAFDLIIPDIEIDFDGDGRVVGAHKVENTESHQIIEEFMLAANEAVARHLADKELNFLRRIHEPPSDMKLRDLRSFLNDLRIDVGPVHSRFDLNQVIELARTRPDRDAINFAVLRAMQKAIYSPRNEGHFALASKHYCHFTSPIRRYPDLVIHRFVGDLIDGKRPADNFGRQVSIGQHCSDLEQRAEAAERELIKLKLLNYFSKRIGEVLPAVVTGVEAYGLFAQGLEIPVEGLVSLNHLPPDHYVYDRATRTLSGPRGNLFRLGDPVVVQVVRVDTDTRQIDFRMIERRPFAAKNEAVQQSKKPKHRPVRATGSNQSRRSKPVKHATESRRPRKHK
ncbi:MAG TPA: ribonuclease R [Pirellulaceae bacterium]|nr:ribonuclease R [Pirellulaceae bacterium]HMO92736.1 ribonuclease R [Pirellulaceae bacterium]HMP70288.1 ribonuclease R [Pirellulaceae bacterium]